MCKTGQATYHQLKQNLFFFKINLNELYDPKEPENITWTMIMYEKMFYDHHTAQHQLTIGHEKNDNSDLLFNYVSVICAI